MIEAEHVEGTEEMKNAHKSLVEGVEGGCKWIHMAHDRHLCWDIMYTVTNLRVSQKAGNFLAS
jgi:hypothetical protein